MTESRFHTPLTPENAALLLVDHQIGLFTGVRDMPVQELTHNVVALTRAAAVLGLPTIVTTSLSDGMWGPLIPELAAALPVDAKIIDRSTVNAWNDTRVREAFEATDRSKLIVAGLPLEVYAALPAISATAAGYDAYVAVDACGTFSATKREAGLLRMQQAGVILGDYAGFIVEALADNASPLAGEVFGALDLSFANLVGQLTAAQAS